MFVATTPCRLVDTRGADLNVGPLDRPIGADETVRFGAHDGSDANSSCSVPPDATALVANVVAVGPSERGYLATFPGDAENPGTATLNFVGGQAPTPNAATIPLASDGSFNVYNAFGTVDVVIDVSGFFRPASLGASGGSGQTGPQGAPGPAGPVGPAGPPGTNGSRNRISDEQIAGLAWYDDPGVNAELDLGTLAKDLVSDGRYVYASQTNDDSVQRIDRDTMEPVGDPIPVGSSPGPMVYVDGRIVVATMAGNSATVIDAATGEVVGDVPVGDFPSAIASDGRFAYVASGNDKQITVVDPRTAVAVGAPIVLGTEADHRPYALAFDGELLWVARRDSVLTVDPITRTIVGNVIPTGTQNPKMIFDGELLWIASWSDELVLVDPVERVVADRLPTSGAPSSLTFDGQFVYVASHTVDTVLVYEAASRGPDGRSFPVGEDVIGLMYDGRNVWSVGQHSGEVRRMVPR